jgi:hypothetical protein
MIISKFLNVVQREVLECKELVVNLEDLDQLEMLDHQECQEKMEFLVKFEIY